MADISKLMDYDKTYPVAIKNPVTWEDIGITFNVVSINSARVVKAARDYERSILASKATGSEIDDLERGEQISRVRLIAAIDSWDWGGNEFGDLGVDPECSEGNKKYVIDHPNADWVRIQLVTGCASIENFTSALPKPARTTSKKK